MSKLFTPESESVHVILDKSCVYSIAYVLSAVKELCDEYDLHIRHAASDSGNTTIDVLFRHTINGIESGIEVTIERNGRVKLIIPVEVGKYANDRIGSSKFEFQPYSASKEHEKQAYLTIGPTKIGKFSSIINAIVD